MKRLILPVLLLMMSLASWAQPGERQMQERIKAQKVAFITERLNLSSEEAQKFWPVYNAYEAEINDMRQNDLREVRQAMRRGNLSNKEAQDLLDQFMAVEEEMHEAKKQLVKDLSGILPPQKIIQLKSAEDAFNRKLLEMLKQRREKMQNRRNKNRP